MLPEELSVLQCEAHFDHRNFVHRSYKRLSLSHFLVYDTLRCSRNSRFARSDQSRETHTRGQHFPDKLFVCDGRHALVMALETTWYKNLKMKQVV